MIEVHYALVLRFTTSSSGFTNAFCLGTDGRPHPALGITMRPALFPERELAEFEANAWRARGWYADVVEVAPGAILSECVDKVKGKICLDPNRDRFRSRTEREKTLRRDRNKKRQQDREQHDTPDPRPQ